jgi:hypothetical protein
MEYLKEVSFWLICSINFWKCTALLSVHLSVLNLLKTIEYILMKFDITEFYQSLLIFSF